MHPRGYPVRLRALGTCKTLAAILWLLKDKIPKTKAMAYVEANRNRDRWEADLLLNVVLAHMAFSSTKDYRVRKMAYDRFKGTVHQLYQFVTAEDSVKDASSETPAS